MTGSGPAPVHIADPRQPPRGVFAYTLHPTRPAMLTEGATDQERALAAEHWAYSQQLLLRGDMVFGGRTLVTTSDSFAICVVRAPSLEAARAIAESDPAVRGGVFAAKVYPFQPMLMGAWPPEAAQAAPAATPHLHPALAR